MFVLEKCRKKLLNFHLKRTFHLLLCLSSVLFFTSTYSVALLFKTSKKKNLNRLNHQIYPYKIISETEFKRSPYLGWLHLSSYCFIIDFNISVVIGAHGLKVQGEGPSGFAQLFFLRGYVLWL